MAVGLVVLALPARLTPTRFLAWLGLLAYVVYSYAIYLIGVPMNRVFLVYVVIESVAGAALLAGLWRLAAMRWPTTASRRLRRGTGWMLVVVAVLFAGLWLSTLLPFAFGGSPPDPEGVGGTPYPVFVLDLVVVLPAIAAVGVLLLRGHRLGPPLAVVALIKIVTLFVALWAGPAYALATDGPVHLGPDAGPEPAAAGRERLARHPLVAHPGGGVVMNTLVVYESMWGNTRAVAEAVAERLGDDVTLVEVTDAPERLPADLDLLVVGGPTHAFSMSRASHPARRGRQGRRHGTRRARHPRVARRGGRPRHPSTWRPSTPGVGSVQHLPGSAAKAAGSEVRRHHLGRLVATESFYVDDMAGPLSDGELDRARAWGASLAGRAPRDQSHLEGVVGAPGAV